MAKALLVVLSAAVLASVAFAQCTTVTNNVYRASACEGYTACTTALCTCAGTTGTAETCLSASTANCTTFTGCTHHFFMCLNALANTARSNTSNPCNSWAVSLHAEMLTSTVSNYNGSTLQAACASRACELKNKTSLGTSCSLGTNYSMVCMPPPTTMAPATTTVAPQTTLPAAIAVRATIRLSGNWTAVLGNATAVAALKVALKGDLATLLNILATFIEIISLTLGSLVVDFAVLPGSNATVSQLENRINSANTNTNWLTQTTAVSAASGGPTTITTTATITTTTVAGATTAAPSTSSASFVPAALVAVAALLALVF